MRIFNGYVLLTVLIFMQIFSLLSIYGFKTALIAMKSQQHAWQYEQTRLLAMHILQQIEKTLPHNDACKIPILPAAQLAKAPLNWWHVYGCSGNLYEMRYYYAVESLGKDACTVIAKMSNKSFTIAYYRITLLALRNDATILLQSTIATASDTFLSCHEPLRLVKLGRQMWREL